MRALRRGRQFGAPVPMRLPVAVASVHRMPPASGPGTNHHKWYRPENDSERHTSVQATIVPFGRRYGVTAHYIMTSAISAKADAAR